MRRARRWRRSASSDVPMIGDRQGRRTATPATRPSIWPDKPAVKLPPRDPLLYFIQRLRDEAHRFAIGSHRTRRKKDIREAGLQEIPGIGPTRKRALLHHFGTLKAIERASLDRSRAGAGHQRRDRPQDPRFLPRIRGRFALAEPREARALRRSAMSRATGARPGSRKVAAAPAGRRPMSVSLRN